MRGRVRRVFLWAGALMVLYGCSVPSDGARPDEIAIAASFSQEDGMALDGGTVRVACGENSREEILDENGESRIAGLPGTGEISVWVFDRHSRLQGTMTLTLTQGEVIDATTDETGAGHVTLRGDTQEVSLRFLLQGDGTIRCSLRLARQASAGTLGEDGSHGI